MGVEKYLEELNERPKKAFTSVEEELHVLIEDHNRLVGYHNNLLQDHLNLWDWHEHNVDIHHEERPSAFGWLAIVFFSFCFNPETVPAILIGCSLGFLVDTFKS